MRKHNTSQHLALVSFALFCLWVQPIFAMATVMDSDLSEGWMNWNRGDEGSTWQEWTFDDADNPTAVAAYYNPNGEPVATLTGRDGSVDFGWLESWDGKDGVWVGDPLYITLDIDNYDTANPYKYIWLEIEYQAVDILDPVLIVDGVTYIPTYYDTGELDGDGNIIDGWKTMVVYWEISPNPDSETISLALAGTGGFLNSISVDTICIPEPTTLLLSGIGLLMTRFRRNKHTR